MKDQESISNGQQTDKARRQLYRPILYNLSIEGKNYTVAFLSSVTPIDIYDDAYFRGHFIALVDDDPEESRIIASKRSKIFVQINNLRVYRNGIAVDVFERSNTELPVNIAEALMNYLGQDKVVPLEPNYDYPNIPRDIQEGSKLIKVFTADRFFGLSFCKMGNSFRMGCYGYEFQIDRSEICMRHINNPNNRNNYDQVIQYHPLNSTFRATLSGNSTDGRHTEWVGSMIGKIGNNSSALTGNFCYGDSNNGNRNNSNNNGIGSISKSGSEDGKIDIIAGSVLGVVGLGLVTSCLYLFRRFRDWSDRRGEVREGTEMTVVPEVATGKVVNDIPTPPHSPLDNDSSRVFDNMATSRAQEYMPKSPSDARSKQVERDSDERLHNSPPSGVSVLFDSPPNNVSICSAKSLSVVAVRGK